MNGNGKSPLEGVPHLDVVISLYPSLGRITVQVPAELQGIAVLGMLEEAKMSYRDGIKQMQEQSRIVVPAMQIPGSKIAS